ncbi:MAG: hypothetical protein SOU06_04340 [Bulleidia sp.]|nr:hypothetical protein [Bulleidia sp.]
MSIIKNTATISLSILMALTSGQVVFAEGEDETSNSSVEKDETVYAFLNSDGSLKKATVSEWLHSEGGFDQIEDESILSDITNIKGDEVPEVNGNKLIWNSTNEDIYYQGSTNKELPLSMEVSYYFDGNKVNPEDILGKSGALEVRIKIINNEEKTQVIKGRTKYISSLFPVAVITDLKTDIFKDIEANDATIINESKNQILTFATVSGASQMLAESDIDTLNDISDKLKDEFVIKANVTDFEMPSILMAASSMTDVDHEDMNSDKLNKLTDGVNSLKDATAEILDGTVKLHDANIELNDKMGEFQSSYAKFQDGINTAKNSQGDIVGGAKQINEGITQMKALMESLTNQLGSLSMDEIGNLLTSAGTTVSSLPETVNTLNSMKAQLEAAKTQLSTLSDTIYAQYTTEKNAADTTALLKEQFAKPALKSLSEQLGTAVDNSTLSIPLTLTDADKKTIADTIATNISLDTTKEGFTNAAGTIIADLVKLKSANCAEAEDSEGCIATAKANAQAEFDALSKEIANSISVDSKAINDGLTSLIASKVPGIQSEVKTAVKTQLGAALNTDDAQNNLAAGAYKASTDIVKNVAKSTQASLTDELTAMQDQLDSAISLCDKMTNSVNGLLDQAKNIDLNKVNSLGSSLQAAGPGIDKLIEGSSKLYDGTKSMQDGLNTLSSSSNDVTDAINKFKDATQELAEQTGNLNSGVQEFSTDGIDKLSTEVDNAIGDLDTVLDTANATLDQSIDYSNYAGAGENMKTTVKFIMKTDEVKKPKDTAINEDSDISKTSSTLLERIANLFKH